MRLLTLLFALTCSGAEPVHFEVPSAPIPFLAADLLAHTTIYGVLPTGSMKPSFDERYWLLVRRVPFARLRLGDVVLFHGDWSTDPICHRIVGRTNPHGWLLTRGDACSSCDPGLVDEQDYVGLVIGIVRRD